MPRKKREEKTVGDLEYKCRRCGVIFTNVSERYPEYGFEVGFNLLYLGEAYWSKADREDYHRQLSRLVAIPLEVPDLPDIVKMHRCEDNQIGISDLIGIVNLRKVVKVGRKLQVLEQEVKDAA